MLHTFADIMLRVALDVGVAKYPSGTDNTPTLPTDPATLFRLTNGVERGRAEFYADFPDAQFRRRTIDFAITNAADPNQVGGDAAIYTLPADWMGPPQGQIVFTGDRGGSVILTSMERVRLAHAQALNATVGFPALVACEREASPQPGEESRWVLRVYPSPDQAYTLALRGRWRAVPFDVADAEPTGHQEAIAAYSTSHLIEKGLVSTGVAPAAAMQTKLQWIARVQAEEGKSTPRTLGRSQPARPTVQLPAILTTNPWNP